MADLEEEKKSQKQEMQWRNYTKSKLDDQENIREIVKKHPYYVRDMK
jgi:hypothetical protein